MGLSNELLERVRARAAKCTTANEAKALYDHAPNESAARAVYEARWTELHLHKN